MIKFGFEKCLYNEKYSFKHYIKHRMGIDLVFLMIVITKTPKNSLGHIDPSKRIEHNFRVRVEVIPALTKKKMKMLNRLNFNCKFNVLLTLIAMRGLGGKKDHATQNLGSLFAQ